MAEPRPVLATVVELSMVVSVTRRPALLAAELVLAVVAVVVADAVLFEGVVRSDVGSWSRRDRASLRDAAPMGPIRLFDKSAGTCSQGQNTYAQYSIVHACMRAELETV